MTRERRTRNRDNPGKGVDRFGKPFSRFRECQRRLLQAYMKYRPGVVYL